MNAPWRPALRYMGGKWRLPPWIIKHMPPHRTYVEPYGGAASVLLRKARVFQEIYNDLDGEIVNLFRVLRDSAGAAELARLVELTPWARQEFELSYEVSPDPVEAARRTVVRSFMGFGSTAVALRRKTGFRSGSDRNGKHPARDFAGMPDALLAICERLRGVVIENRPALQVMAASDDPATLIYADPPYVHESRSQKRVNGQLEHAYAFEMGGGRSPRAPDLASRVQIHGAAQRLRLGSLRPGAGRLAAGGRGRSRGRRPAARRVPVAQRRGGGREPRAV